MFLLLLVAQAQATCESGTTADAISASVGQAQLAMASYDEDAFAAAAARVTNAVPCLTQVATPLDAAVIHGFVGLEAFVEGRTDEAKLAFASAHAASSAYTVPAAIAPPGGPLSALLVEAYALPPAEPTVLPAFDGIIYVDGARSSGLLYPKDRPSLIQLVTSEGTVKRTVYHKPGESLPLWEAPRTGFAVVLPRVREKPSTPLGIAAGGAAVAAGSLYVVGGIWHEQYTSGAAPYEDLDALETRTNVALASSLVLGAAAVGLGTVTFLRW